MFVWLNVCVYLCVCTVCVCVCAYSCPVSLRLPCSDFCISVFRFVVKSFVCSLPIKRVQLATSVSFHFISFFAIICETSDVSVDADVSVSDEAIRHGILIIRIKLFFGFRFATQRSSTLLATMQPASQQQQQQQSVTTITSKRRGNANRLPFTCIYAYLSTIIFVYWPQKLWRHADSASKCCKKKSDRKEVREREGKGKQGLGKKSIIWFLNI